MTTDKPQPRTIDTADALRMIPYRSPVTSWHSHGDHLVPTDGCHSCRELRRRQAEGEGDSRKSGE